MLQIYVYIYIYIYIYSYMYIIVYYICRHRAGLGGAEVRVLPAALRPGGRQYVVFI